MGGLLLALGAMTGARGEDLKAQALREKKPCMVLCVGSDWCISGEAVRRTFTSDAFRKALKGPWLFGVRNAWDHPCPAAVSNENARVKSLPTATDRYPALFLFDEKGEKFAGLENLPFDLTGTGLAARVAACVAVRDQARGHFAAGRYGEGLDLLRSQVPHFLSKQRKNQMVLAAGAAEWAKMRGADPEDKEGWCLHFTMGDGIADVAKANGLATHPAEGTNFIATLRQRPMGRCTVEQRQSVDMAEFAFLRRDPAARSRCIDLLQKVYTADPATLWGWAAQGFLSDFGAAVAPAATNRAAAVVLGEGVVDRALRARGGAKPRTDEAARRAAAARAAIAPLFAQGGPRTAADEFALVRARAFDCIGTNAVQRVLEREGGAEFVEAFFADKTWLEDFCASGPVADYPAAFTNLETFVWNEPHVAKAGVGRRIATAIALNSPLAKAKPLFYVRSLAAYLRLLDVGRLHAAALKQTVREWRFGVGAVLDAADILWINHFYNMPHEDYAKAFRAVPYRMYNCFGDYIHRPKLYYGPWRDCVWPTLKMKQRVGGVCGVLSGFGVQATNAHGLPASTGGQPGHCIFNRRKLDGSWTIHNYITRYSTVRYSFWGSAFTFLDVIERSFADRAKQLAAERFLWLAFFAAQEKAPWPEQEAWFRRAVAAAPKHYGAWRSFAYALVREKAAPERFHAYLQDLVRALPEGRQATWEGVQICLASLAKLPQGPSRVVDELEQIYPKLPRVTTVPTREELDFAGIVRDHLKLVRRPVLRERLIKAALAAQTEMGAFYFQLAETCSRVRDVALFQAVAADYERRAPVPADAARYPETDFGGTLLSAKGLLALSSSAQNRQVDRPELYARAIGSLKVADPAYPKNLHTFRTRGEKAPWALVQLPQAADVTGILLTNPFWPATARQQVPFVVAVSVDGRNWTDVFRTDEVRAEYRIPLTSPERARYVKVARVPSEVKTPFRFGKFLVYGTVVPAKAEKR